MAGNMTVSSVTHGAVNQSAKTEAVATVRNSNYSPPIGPDGYVRSSMLANTSASPTHPTHQIDGPTQRAHPPSNRSNNYTHNAACDTTWYYRAYGGYQDNGQLGSYPNDGTDYSWDTTLKTYAIEPTVDTPVLDNVAPTSSTITADADVTPGTDETSCTATFQYKKTTDGTWTDWGSSDTVSGYTETSMTQVTITGLDSSTSYDVRVKLDRSGTTNAVTLYYSSTASASTAAGDPEATTSAATSVTNSQAQLNGSIAVNDEASVVAQFVYGTSNPPVEGVGDAVTVTATESPLTEDGSISKTVTGLSASTTYYFFARAEWDAGASGDNGSTLSFTTSADPAADAAAESHCNLITVTGKRGVALTIPFVAMEIGGTSADRLVTGSASFSGATGYLYQDGAYSAETTNSPSQVSAGKQLYTITLTAAEMGANFVDVILTDSGTNFRDVRIRVFTELNLGNVDIDASNGSNLTALKLTGQGTEHGLEAIGGATGSDIEGILGDFVVAKGTVASYDSSTVVTLDSGINATAEETKGCCILFYEGAGAGQARVILNHTAARAIKLNKALTVAVDATTKYIIFGIDQMFYSIQFAGTYPVGMSPGAELTDLPNFNDTYAEFIQWLFQRIVYKRTETATVHQMIKVDDAEVIAQYGVDDDGSTETKQRAEDV